ncbi:sigma-70 region 4 domain-containing protein [Brevibacterium sp. p3-SID960]|uniref:sigma-70 region 4 domain-containing protein n=1 Tax=Brevibacterium sp. p3-SID960 TaxID=2916063 RepID=UPI0021A57AC8|nr:sigma-70 region 4 domain-containing protein [Brevibacterium sp. p3-SID960]MCT1691610.1 sigma-70 region 4 domain-containing protein [Brevibacterium sp. p3-SID960]
MRGGSKSKNGLEVARKRGKDGDQPRVIDDDKRTVILARREKGESIREIAATTGVSVGAVLGVESEEKAGASSS